MSMSKRSTSTSRTKKRVDENKRREEEDEKDFWSFVMHGVKRGYLNVSLNSEKVMSYTSASFADDDNSKRKRNVSPLIKTQRYKEDDRRKEEEEADKKECKEDVDRTDGEYYYSPPSLYDDNNDEDSDVEGKTVLATSEGGDKKTDVPRDANKKKEEESMDVDEYCADQARLKAEDMVATRRSTERERDDEVHFKEAMKMLHEVNVGASTDEDRRKEKECAESSESGEEGEDEVEERYWASRYRPYKGTSYLARDERLTHETWEVWCNEHVCYYVSRLILHTEQMRIQLRAPSEHTKEKMPTGETLTVGKALQDSWTAYSRRDGDNKVLACYIIGEARKPKQLAYTNHYRNVLVLAKRGAFNDGRGRGGDETKALNDCTREMFGICRKREKRASTAYFDYKPCSPMADDLNPMTCAYYKQLYPPGLNEEAAKSRLSEAWKKAAETMMNSWADAKSSENGGANRFEDVAGPAWNGND